MALAASAERSRPSLWRRIAERLRWEAMEWRSPSRHSFIQDELDAALLAGVAWPAGERVLDVGCGDGRYSIELGRRGVRMIAVDADQGAVARAVRRGVPALGASGLALPFLESAFDAILCHRALYLMSPPQAAVRELARLVRPGGRIVFSGSNTNSPYARVQARAVRRSGDRRWRFANRWPVQRWQQAFAGLGFRTTAVYSCNLVWPVVFRVRDRWLLPNEWMRRYARAIRRVSGVPLRTARPLGAAMDYVVEMTRPR